MSKVIITGITGMDGSHLSDMLVKNGDMVYGLIRCHSSPETQTVRIDHLRGLPDFHLKYCDVTDSLAVSGLVSEIQPDMIFHFAAQSHVQISFENPLYTTQVNCTGTLNILEAARLHCPSARIYHAASSEMFGNNSDSDGYQRETTPFAPVSPYGSSKLYAHNICDNYRKSYGMFVCSGICFNHESPRRGINFVTNKVVKGAVEIKSGTLDVLELGSLDPQRDWGHACDYVKGMRLMLQQDKPNDYVLATGETRSVRELVEYVFGSLGLDVDKHVALSQKFVRPQELWTLKGDASLARKELGWKCTYSFTEILDEMIEYWIDRLQ